ncbi:lcsI Cytochrome P450 monooxygenase lcsI [Candida maltosa Xu316]
MLKEAAFSVYHYVSAHPVQAQTGIAIAFIIYYFIVLPIKSPLWRIPGPYIHRVSYIPCLNAQRKGEWIRKVHALHKQFGDVVILSPNEISVNGQSKFITDIYFGKRPLINNLYNKSAIFSKENHTRSVLLKTAAKLVERVGEESPSIDVFTLFGALAMDVVSRFELGPDNGTHLLDLPNERFIIESHRKVSSMGFWTTLMPNFLWDFAATRATLKAVDDICNFQLNLYKFAEKNVSSNGKNLTTMETLKKNGLTGEHCYSFLTDNLFAGHETTAVSMTYLCYELSRPRPS